MKSELKFERKIKLSMLFSSVMGCAMSFSPISYAAGLGDELICDQRTPPLYLRYLQRYKLKNDYVNNSAHNHKIIKAGTDAFLEKLNYNLSSDGEKFFYTHEIMDANKVVAPSLVNKYSPIFTWKSILPMLSSYPFKNGVPRYHPDTGVVLGGYYNVYEHPSIRDGSADIFIKFFVEAQEEMSAGSWVNLSRHTTCASYIITWCGDGVKDAEVGDGETWTAESCDDGSNNGKLGYCNPGCTGRVVSD